MWIITLQINFNKQKQTNAQTKQSTYLNRFIWGKELFNQKKKGKSKGKYENKKEIKRNKKRIKRLMKMIMEAVIVIILWHYNTMKMRISELSEYQK